MDDAVVRSLARWPNVPAVYGWLELDRRGNWRIKGERIGNAALREFIARNYAADERGCWFFQNGPQRVYVALAYTPLVVHYEGERLFDHCGGVRRSARDVRWTTKARSSIRARQRNRACSTTAISSATPIPASSLPRHASAPKSTARFSFVARAANRHEIRRAPIFLRRANFLFIIRPLFSPRAATEKHNVAARFVSGNSKTCLPSIS